MPGRTLRHHGSLLKKTAVGKVSRHYFLFSDAILTAEATKGAGKMRATFSGASALGANAQAELKRRKLLPLRGAKVRVPLDMDPSYFELDFDRGEIHLDGEIEVRGLKALPRDRATSSTRTEGDRTEGDRAEGEGGRAEGGRAEGGRAEGSPRHERGAEAEGGFGSTDKDRESKVNRLHAGSPEEQQRWVGELCAVLLDLKAAQVPTHALTH